MNLRNVLQIKKEKPEERNIQRPVGLGSTRILMDYAQKSPGTPCGFDWNSI